MRKRSVFLDSVNTLDNFSPSCFFEKFPLGYHGLCLGPFTNGDFDHRRSRGETRIRQVPNTIIDRNRLIPQLQGPKVRELIKSLQNAQEQKARDK